MAGRRVNRVVDAHTLCAIVCGSGVGRNTTDPPLVLNMKVALHEWIHAAGHPRRCGSAPLASVLTLENMQHPH
jgi:hypothetical protein